MSSLWYIQATPEQLNMPRANTMVSHLGIEFIEVGENFLRARMPVDQRTIQPYGILHGGASTALAETMGSVAASLTLDLTHKVPVGMEINANHIRPVPGGSPDAPRFVYGVTTPIHLGSTTQVWDIRITDEKDRLVCIARLTIAVVPRKE